MLLAARKCIEGATKNRARSATRLKVSVRGYCEVANAKKRVAQLRRLLKQYSKAYYVDAKPIVSDAEYDLLFGELGSLESKYPNLASPSSPTQTVGSSIRRSKTGTELVAHKTPMLSLANAFSTEEILAFDARIKRMTDTTSSLRYIVEFKYDGIAMSLHYEHGKFVRALTRGDGKIGEEVSTAIAFYLPNLVQDLPNWQQYGSYIEIRGELFMTKDAFRRVNEESGGAYSSARNLTSGLLKRKADKKKDANEKKAELSFVAYNLISSEPENEPESHWEILKAISALGLPNGHPHVAQLDDIVEWEALEKDWASKRSSLPFEVDGMVIKLDDRKLYSRLGFTSHSPRFALAWKFSARQATTTINTIELSVGRTGKVTPVAIVEPVKLSGSLISRATLHNRDYIEKLRLVPGCRVTIERSGDVIPKIVGRVDDSTLETGKLSADASINWSVCPCDLKSALVPVGNVDLACTNPLCPPQRQRQLEHFAAALEIDGLGPSSLKQLVEFGMVSDFGDLFKLREVAARLKVKDGWADKKVENLISQIEAAKSRSTFSTLLFALGVPHVGKETASTLAAKAGSMERLRQMTEEQLESLDDVGPVVARSIASYLRHGESVRRIDELVSLGFGTHEFLEGGLGATMSGAQEEGIISGVQTRKPSLSSPSTRRSGISGKSVVITGALTGMSRKEAEHLVKQLGGTVKPTISKTTDLLVEGRAPASSGHTASTKLAKAKLLGIRVVSEEEFLQLTQPQQ